MKNRESVANYNSKRGVQKSMLMPIFTNRAVKIDCDASHAADGSATAAAL